MDKYLEVIFKDQKLQGILVKETQQTYILKLENGYNVVVNKENTQIISSKATPNPKNTQQKEVETKNKKLPQVVFLHTGGTIASKIDYKTGAVTSNIEINELLSLYPELTQKANILPKKVLNLSSEDMRFSHYNALINEIAKQCQNTSIDGILISHGTDTMHYTSAALQYAIKNLPVPVLLVGSQRSSDRPSSDAFLNLDAALQFIIDQKNKTEKYLRVGAAMHKDSSDNLIQIFDGINLKKLHSSKRGAFKQINAQPVAEVNTEKIIYGNDSYFNKLPKKKLEVSYYDENLKLGFFKAHPNLHPQEIEILSKLYDGVVIEGTGLGHLAVTKFDDLSKVNEENLFQIQKLTKKIPVVIGVQTVYGRTNLNIYSSGRYLKNTGVYGHGMNLSTETLFIRLAYCLSKNKDFNQIWSKNLEN